MTVQKATLKPYLEEIREWVAQGRTDIWIAHALNSTPASISAFRSANGIPPARAGRRAVGGGRAPADRAARRASRGAAGQAAATVAVEEDARADAAFSGGRGRSRAPDDDARAAPVVAASSEDGPAPAKRRRRGGRGRNKKPQQGFEATLDTGDEGFGFWLDGAVKDDPVFAEHWASRRGLIVRIEADQIVIRPDEREA